MINLSHMLLKKIYSIYTLQQYTYVHIALIKKIIYNHITVYYIGLADLDDCNTHYKSTYIEIDGTQLSENICSPRIKWASLQVDAHVYARP